MLTKRIIPCLDVRDGNVVKGKKFKCIKTIGSPEILAKYYSDNGADELVFYDITASKEKRDISLDFVKRVAENINIPFCVGGGVRSLDDFRKILRSGADKISINTVAVENPNLIVEAAECFGSQCVVVSIDAKKEKDGKWSVYTMGGRNKTNLDAILWAQKAVKLGAGEIVVNSINQDGMKNGYDIELLKQLNECINIPIIASGGAGKKEHFLEAVKYAEVDGILAASVFHYDEIKISDLKSYLKTNGVEVRI